MFFNVYFGCYTSTDFFTVAHVEEVLQNIFALVLFVLVHLLYNSNNNNEKNNNSSRNNNSNSINNNSEVYLLV